MVRFVLAGIALLIGGQAGLAEPILQQMNGGWNLVAPAEHGRGDAVIRLNDEDATLYR